MLGLSIRIAIWGTAGYLALDGWLTDGIQSSWILTIPSAWITSQFIKVYFQTLLAIALTNEKNSDGDADDMAWGIAKKKILSIAGWTVLDGTAAGILGIFKSHKEYSFLARVGDMAWSTASLLAVPIIASTDKNPIQALEISIDMVSKKLGESVTGNAGLWMGFHLTQIILSITGTLAVWGLIMSSHPIPAIACGLGTGAAILGVRSMHEALVIAFGVELLRQETTSSTS